jgi:hypothetical protein
LYIKLQNNKQNNKQNIYQPQPQEKPLPLSTQILEPPLQQVQKISKSQELKNLFSDIIETSEKLNSVSNNLKDNNEKNETIVNNEKVELIEDDNDSNSNDTESDNESVSTEDLDNIQEHLNKLLEEKVNVDNLIKEKDDELADMRCEQSYQRQLKNKEKSKEEEKYNIFRADINIYKRIMNNFNERLNEAKIKEQNIEDIKLENFIPPMFEAKFYVIKFLYDENLIEESDYEQPSQELYEIYNILYKARFDETYDIPDDFEDIITKFIHQLPDKTILTTEELHLHLNNESKHELLFVQKEEEENLNNSN